MWDERRSKNIYEWYEWNENKPLINYSVAEEWKTHSQRTHYLHSLQFNFSILLLKFAAHSCSEEESDTRLAASYDPRWMHLEISRFGNINCIPTCWGIHICLMLISIPNIFFPLLIIYICMYSTQYMSKIVIKPWVSTALHINSATDSQRSSHLLQYTQKRNGCDWWLSWLWLKGKYSGSNRWMVVWHKPRWGFIITGSGCVSRWWGSKWNHERGIYSLMMIEPIGSAAVEGLFLLAVGIWWDWHNGQLKPPPCWVWG